MYMPSISDSRTVHRYKAGDHFVDVRTDIKSVGAIEYTHMAIVFEDLEKPPVFFVTAEVNTNPAGLPNPESHFLCSFREKGHFNHGARNDIADFEIFEKAAMNLINEQYAPHLPRYE